MTALSIFALPDTIQPAEQIDKFNDIVELLAGAGIRLEHWESGALPDTSDDDALLSHFQCDIDRLKQLEGYTAADVIRITPEHPDREVLRKNSCRSIPTVKMRCDFSSPAVVLSSFRSVIRSSG